MGLLSSIKDFTLGDGFIMSSYSNMMFLPDRRIFGLDLGIDGALFNYPAIGFDAIAGNLARFDVFGGRVFVRPFHGSAAPLRAGLQAGSTLVVDRLPYRYGEAPFLNPETPVVDFGADLILPIVGGRVAGFLTWGAQLRFLQSGFIPSYFDMSYGLYRQARFDPMHEPKSGINTSGWYALVGLSLFKYFLVFTMALDGPLARIPAGFEKEQAKFPHARTVLRLGEGLLPVYFDAAYEKYYLGRKSGFFPDLIGPEDSVIGLSANYRTGPSVLSLMYDAVWDPLTLSLAVSTSIQSTIKL
jgi:hypothetical protein